MDRVVSQTDPLLRQMTWAYNGSTTRITDAAVTDKTFDEFGNITIKTRGVGSPHAASWQYKYDIGGRPTSATDPNGRTTLTSWDLRGNLVRTQDPLNRVTTRTYNAYGDPLTITDPTNVVTTLTYDGAGNLTSTSRPLTATAQTATTTFGYDLARPGDVVTITNPLGQSSHLTYDAAGNLTSETDPLGNRTTHTYNTIGWRLTSTSPRGNAVGRDPQPVHNHEDLHLGRAAGHSGRPTRSYRSSGV